MVGVRWAEASPSTVTTSTASCCILAWRVDMDRCTLLLLLSVCCVSEISSDN